MRRTRVFGYWMGLDLSNYIERSIYLHVFEPFETSLVRGLLRPGMTIVDAGANVGYYTLMGSAAVGPSGHVFAFEPSPYAVKKLREAIDENKIENVTIVESALGDFDGVGQLYVPDQDRGNHTPSMVAQNFPPTSIAITTLDSFLRKRGVRRVELLKLDVEGFEPNIVRGARQVLEDGTVRAILCEFNEYWLTANGCSSKELLTLLEDLGFHSEGGEFVPGLALQNLLLVRD